MLSAYTESDPAFKDSLNHLKGNCQSDHMFDPPPGLYLRVCTKNNFLISEPKNMVLVLKRTVNETILLSTKTLC